MNLTDWDRSAIRRVICAQLDALRSRDGARALSYSSPERQRFGTGERFLEIVQEGFPQLVHPRHTQFGALKLVRGRWMQQVTFLEDDVPQASVVFVMDRQPDASWRIDGCVQLARPIIEPQLPQYLN